MRRVNDLMMGSKPLINKPEKVKWWRDTERALRISETARKDKVGILRLDPRLQDGVRHLPAEHAIQIARLNDPERQ
ncbi:MAG: hypothetical protein M3256_06340, partial [Actinomycetota bacterium]|nr:hypothetical protein [Actinomycetota bacterium]